MNHAIRESSFGRFFAVAFCAAPTKVAALPSVVCSGRSSFASRSAAAQKWPGVRA